VPSAEGPLTSPPLAPPLPPIPPAQPWLPWLGFGVVAGAAGLVGPQWWWLALLAAPLAVLFAPRYTLAARALLALAAVCAGGWLAQPVAVPGSEPRLYAVAGTVAMVLPSSYGQSALIIPTHSDDPGGYLPARILVRGPSLPALAAGDEILARGLWSREVRGDRLQAVAWERTARREDGARGPAWRALGRFATHGELAGALLIGQGVPSERPLFRRTGLVHVLAVSGMHLALAAAMGAWLLWQLRISWHWRQVALIGLLVGYTWLTAASPATVRALAMALALTGYALLAREPHRLGAAALAALALTLWDPATARDLGFQLSLVAVLGILTLGMDLVRLRQRWLPLAPWPLDRPSWRILLAVLRAVADGVLVGVAATLAISPILALAFGSVTPWSPLTTVLVTPPTTVALWTGLPLLGLAGVWPDGPWEGLYLIVEWSLAALVWTVELADRLPGQIAVAPAPALVVLLWPLAFIPCERAWQRLTDTPPWPWATTLRLALAGLLVLAWWWAG
jgi:ComEC/Rec2-related protein